MTIDDDELHLHNEVSDHGDAHAHDEDRLPWLEAVEPDGDHEAGTRGRITGLLIAAVSAIVLLIGGLWWMNTQVPPPKGGDGKLIAAQDGDYKTKPNDAGGMKVDGQGDSSAATAQGAGANGKLDTSAQPEVPVKPVTAKAPAPNAPAKPNAVAKIADVTDVTAKPAPAPVAIAKPVAPGGGVIQLGAFGSQNSAQQGWADLKAKFPMLASLTQTIEPAAVGGSTVYRLRVAAGSAAADTCAKLKAGGANCIMAR